MLTKRDIEKLKKMVNEYYKKAQIDNQNFDVEAEIDRSVSYSENKNMLIEKLKELSIIPIEEEFERVSKKVAKEIIEHEEFEQIKKFELESQKKQQEAIEKMKKTTPKIQEYFKVPRSMLKAFLDEKQTDIAGMILKGGTGIGKTRMAIDIFNELGWKLNEDYAVLSGYTTPLKLFAFLYENRNKKVILFDDIAKMFDNELSRGLLLAALWNTAGERFITYLSSSDKLTDEQGLMIPKTFELKAKILWCLNDLPKELDNIKSRVYYYEMDFDYPTKMQIIYEICKIENIPIEIADFIKENTDESYPVDFRLPLKLFGFYKTQPNSWEELANAILKPDEDLAIIREILDKTNSIKEAVQEYTQRTGHSRATFFRHKKMLMERNGIKVS